jgi:galactokinase/mevalonate kinase-like predicted kinase
MIVRARAPLRLGFGGGGSDLSPYCDTYGGFVLNATIDKYAYAIVQPRDGDEVELVASDQDVRIGGRTDELFTFDGVLDLHKGVYNRIVRAGIDVDDDERCAAGLGPGIVVDAGRRDGQGVCRVPQLAAR